MGIKISGVEQLIASLSQVGKTAQRGVADEMRKGAVEIRDLARENAPRDEGDLESAIKVEEDRSGINGRVQVYVFVDGDTLDDRGRPVGEYATVMHEGQYNLGENSVAKQAGNPSVVVGRKYLERAADEIGASLTQRMAAVMKRKLR